MRICILTTETLHHMHFVRSLISQDRELLVIMETKTLKAPYAIIHNYEAMRDEYEKNLWFNGSILRMQDIARTKIYYDVNELECVNEIKEFSPNLIVTFGTGPLKDDIIEVGGDYLLNLHGGDPEEYRGLDSHLWAIWHRDFASLVTCLHRVEKRLDTGSIIACLPVDICPGMGLHQLRSLNTVVCVRLIDLAMRQFLESGKITSRPQRYLGRYYSFMPSSLKEQCVEKFARYTGGL
jgi:folate-dependent phosphoribosylglycinamide formyltransferase PurN